MINFYYSDKYNIRFTAEMKTYKKFLSESINISGNASIGTLIVNDSNRSSMESMGEHFCADFMWKGSIYRIELISDSKNLPSREKLAEQLQNDYPGAIVHNIYPFIESNNSYKVSDLKRYNPTELNWISG